MSLITYPITLNCKKTDIQKRIKAFKSEGNERQLIITLTNGDKTIYLNPNDHQVSFIAKKPDGTQIANNATITDGKAIYTLTTQTLAAEGDVNCQMRVTTESGLLFTAKFVVEVADNLGNIPAEESTDEYDELVELIRLAGKGKVYVSEYIPPTDTLEGVEDLKENDIYIQTESNDVKIYKCTQIAYSHGVLTHIEWELEATVYTKAKVDLLLEALSNDLQTVIVNAVGVETRNRQAADIETLNNAKAYTDEKVAPKQDALTAGLNISIDDVDDDKVISVDNKITSDAKYFYETRTEEIDVSDYSKILFKNIEQEASGILRYSLDGTVDYDVSEGLLVDIANVNTLYLSYEKIAGMGGCFVTYNMYSDYNLIRLEDATTLLQPVKAEVQTKQDILTAQRAINISYDNKISSTGTMCHFGTVNPETSNLTQQDFPNMRVGDLYYYYGNGKPYLIYSGSYGTFMAKPFEFNNYKSDTDPITTCYTTDKIYYLLEVGTVWHNTTSGESWICTNIETGQGSATYTWLPLEATDLSNYYTKTQVDDIAAGKQAVIDSTHKLSADLVDDTNSTNKFVTESDKQTWSGKQDTLTAGNGIEIENDEVSVDTDVIATNESVDEKIAEIPQPRPITDTAKGNAITLTDSTDEPINAISIMGKSTQNGTPTIDNPIPIVDITAEEIEVTNGTDTQTAELDIVLRGIPVTSGGNYTDNNNQQWLCDTIERYKDGSGKYIQRVGSISGSVIGANAGAWYGDNITTNKIIGFTITNSQPADNNLKAYAYCTHFKRDSAYGNRVCFQIGGTQQIDRLGLIFGFGLDSTMTFNDRKQWVQNLTDDLRVVYPLYEYIETPLTAEQLEELNLDTYYPTTNINSNADVVVEYVCDTKNYIDKKTSALTSAIISLGGNI